MIPPCLEDEFIEVALKFARENYCPDCYKRDEEYVICDEFEPDADWTCANYRCIGDVIDEIESNEDNIYNIPTREVLRRMRGK